MAVTIVGVACLAVVEADQPIFAVIRVPVAVPGHRVAVRVPSIREQAIVVIVAAALVADIADRARTGEPVADVVVDVGDRSVRRWAARNAFVCQTPETVVGPRNSPAVQLSHRTPIPCRVEGVRVRRKEVFVWCCECCAGLDRLYAVERVVPESAAHAVRVLVRDKATAIVVVVRRRAATRGVVGYRFKSVERIVAVVDAVRARVTAHRLAISAGVVRVRQETLRCGFEQQTVAQIVALKLQLKSLGIQRFTSNPFGLRD